MKVYDIIRKYLIENGYTGLYNDECECACSLDRLVSCKDIETNCQAGYYAPCGDCKNKQCDKKLEIFDFGVLQEKCSEVEL